MTTFQRARILYEDFLATATLSGGSYEDGDGLSLENVKSSRLGIPARTTDATEASTMFDIDFGANKQIDMLAFLMPNISPGARYRIRSYEESGRTTVAYDSGEKSLPGFVVDSLDLEWEDSNFWYGVNTEGLLTEFKPLIVESVPDEQATNANKRYWRVNFYDTGNVDGYLDIARAMAGRCFKPAINYDEDNAFGIVALTDVSESLSGSRSYNERGIRRILQLSFKNMDWTEAFGDYFRMLVKARDSRQVVVVPEYSDDVFLQERSFIATMKQLSPLQQKLVDRASTTFNLEEAK